MPLSKIESQGHRVCALPLFMESSNLSFRIKKFPLRQEIIIVFWVHMNWYCEINGLTYNGFCFPMQWHTNLKWRNRLFLSNSMNSCKP